MHWTAGGPSASALDKQHYHFLYQQDLSIIKGNLPPEENIRTNDGVYGAHTRMLNTGSIGVAFCGMMGARDLPLTFGPHPLTWDQIKVGCAHIAQLADRYKIPVTRQCVLTHAEVQPTLGVRQNGKWDIRVLPGDKLLRNAVTVGDELRDKIKSYRR